VVLDDRPGHVSGALLLGYLNSAVRMSEDGYAPREAIDTAMTLGCGLASGPFAQLDAIGLDTALDALNALYERTRERVYQPTATLHRLVEAGRLGRKTGAGFYDYSKPGAGIPGAASSSLAKGSPASPPVIRRVGVVGSGTMATGIAEVCARGGYPVHLVARAEDKAERARMAVGRSLERAVSRGRLSGRDGDAAAGRLTVGVRLADLAACDLVIEAISEDLPAKKRLFAELDLLCTSAALLATTTSSLPVTACAEVSAHPGRVVGLHFFNPPPAMKLVEIVTTRYTPAAAARAAAAFCAGVGKHGIGCGDRPGFIVNTLLFPYLNRAVRMLESGDATAEEIDTVMKDGCGYPMGPLRLLDTVGLDVAAAILRALHQAFGDPDLAPRPALADLVEAGDLGRKSGSGFHSYVPVHQR
jgi:3-hydroxybutyryl-CoA dehydrogenase